MGAPTTRDGDDFVPIAEVVKPVGLRGQYKLYPLLDWHPPLFETEFLRWRDGAPFRLAASRPDGVCLVVATADCATREEAEARVGREIGFDRSRYLDPSFPRPPEGLPFRYLGRTVVTVAGEEVGRVREVRRYATQVLLVVERGASPEVLVPAVPPILRRDEGLEGPLVIDPPPGLIDGTALSDGA